MCDTLLVSALQLCPNEHLSRPQRGAWETPFVLLMMFAVLLLCFFPEISTWLPNLVMGPDGGR